MAENSWGSTLAPKAEACGNTHHAHIGNITHVCALPTDHEGQHEDADTTVWL